MSAYSNDPRVTNLGGDVYVVTCCPGEGPQGHVQPGFGGGFVAAVDGDPEETFHTADEAIRSLIGDPQ